MRVWEENECKRSTGLTTALSAPRELAEQGCCKLHPSSISEMFVCCDAASQTGSDSGEEKWAVALLHLSAPLQLGWHGRLHATYSQSWGEGHVKWPRSNIRGGWCWSMHTPSGFLLLHPTPHWILLCWPRLAKEIGFALGSSGEILQTVHLWDPFQPKPFCGSILWLSGKHWQNLALLHSSEGSSSIEAEICSLFCNLPRRSK